MTALALFTLALLVIVALFAWAVWHLPPAAVTEAPREVEPDIAMSYRAVLEDARKVNDRALDALIESAVAAERTRANAPAGWYTYGYVELRPADVDPPRFDAADVAEEYINGLDT
jgi:hypothetical protein